MKAIIYRDLGDDEIVITQNSDGEVTIVGQATAWETNPECYASVTLGKDDLQSLIKDLLELLNNIK